MTSHMSAAPVPVIYSTPSGLHAVSTAGGAALEQPGVKGSHGITGTQITFLASPIITPAGTPVSESKPAATAAGSKPKQHNAIRHLLLSPK